ncbi:hypothetical protein [Companilactobacillus zhongbaensis]|uniref:hypothetical protein n=1 Tax=Companilactobacillus zhongbaensis TaxID=2486009 RepID=UPI000F7A5907|nr:hypothetical protein [Companilactobacillus zhongbaensis]
MTYREFLQNNRLKKPDYKMFDIILKGSPNIYVQTFGRNGYVVIPDDWTLDYCSNFYGFLDDGPVGGLTFGGYITVANDELTAINLDSGNLGFFQKELNNDDKKAIEEIKKYCVHVIGFDNQHYRPNEMDAFDGAKYIAEQLRNRESTQKTH